MSSVILFTIFNLTTFVQRFSSTMFINTTPTAGSSYSRNATTVAFTVWKNGIESGNVSNSTWNSTIPLEKHYWALSLLSIPAATIFGNLLVITSVCKFHHLHSPINYFILGMAVADLLVAIAVMPFAVYVEVNNGFWEFGPLVCDLFCAADVTCSTASIFLLTIISFDRYVAATHPIKYANSNKGVCQVTLINFVAWFVALCIASPMVLGLNNVNERDSTTCRFYNADFIIYSSTGSFCIPLILIIYLYARIWKVIKHRSRMARQRQAKLPMHYYGPDVQDPLLSSDKQGTLLTTDSSIKYPYNNNGVMANHHQTDEEVEDDNLDNTELETERVAIDELFQRCPSIMRHNNSNTLLRDKFDKVLSRRSSLQNLSNRTLNELFGKQASTKISNNNNDSQSCTDNLNNTKKESIHYIKSFSMGSPARSLMENKNGVLYKNEEKNMNSHSKRLNESQTDFLQYINKISFDEKMPKVAANNGTKKDSSKVLARRSTGFLNGNFLAHTPELFRDRTCTSLSAQSANSELSVSNQDSSGDSVNLYGDNVNSSNTNSMNWCSEQDVNQDDDIVSVRRKSGMNLGVNSTSGVQSQLSLKNVLNRRKLNRKICKSQRKERKATKTLAIVLGVFLVCWVPFFTLNVLNAICIKLEQEVCQVGLVAFSLSTWLGYMNSFMSKDFIKTLSLLLIIMLTVFGFFLDPIIYTIFNIDFRRAFKQLLCPCFVKRRNSTRRV